MRNTVNLIKNKKAKFSDGFCTNRFVSSAKCYNFYIKNIQNNFEGLTRCPYGYACYFYKNIVLSSIVDEKNCDLKCILSRVGYMRRQLNINQKVKILSVQQLEKLLLDTKQQNELDAYRDTFHDLNNNNRSLKDLVEKITPFFNENLILHLNKLFDIFEQHNVNLLQVNDFLSKLRIYKEEIKRIDEIKNEILKDKILQDSKFYDLKSNFEFIDYRIRYLKRIVNSDYNHHLETFKKDLSVHKIIKKLVYAFESTLRKKDQKIELNVDNYGESYNIIAYDDIYLGFFILLENAVKYSSLGSKINVYISRNTEHYVEVIIENDSEYISNTDLLTKRGTQGDNYKDGSGLGLSIAEDIFAASNLVLTVSYVHGKFLCIIKNNEYFVVGK